MTKEGWQAPKTVPSIEHLRVTGRPFERVYENAFIDDSEMQNKTVLSLGNGLSDLVEHINSLGGDTHGYGVDPIYSFLGKDYDEFLANLKKHNLDTGVFAEKEEYGRFKDGLKRGYYIGSVGESLPFKSKTVDLVVASQLIGNIEEDKVLYGVIDEMLRVIKPGGEIRIPEVCFPTWKKESTAERRVVIDFSPGSGYAPLNYKKREDWLRIMNYIDEQGVAIYSVFKAKGGRRYDDIDGGGAGTTDIYQGLILRLDTEVPRITVYLWDRDKHEQSSSNLGAVIKLNPSNSNITELHYANVPSEVSLKPSLLEKRARGYKQK